MNGDDNFNASDRQTLIELRVDMRYTKEAIDRLGRETDSAAVGTARDVKDLWSAVDDLRKFRWWMGGGLGASAFIGGIIARVLFHGSV